LPARLGGPGPLCWQQRDGRRRQWGCGATCYLIFDVGEKGEKAGEVVDRLGALAEVGFQVAIGQVARVWEVTPLEVIGSEVIPAVAGL
jgi:hypothetical protein